MSNLSNFQYPPPKNWQDFESLCRDLWEKIWNDPNTQKNGRSGQEQNGVDVFGQPNQLGWAGVQGKGKDNYSQKTVTVKELSNEVEKAKKFKPSLSSWILATTGVCFVNAALNDWNVSFGKYVAQNRPSSVVESPLVIEFDQDRRE